MIATLALKRNPEFLVSRRFVKVLVHLQWLLRTKKAAEVGQEKNDGTKNGLVNRNVSLVLFKWSQTFSSSFHYIVVCRYNR